MVIINILVFLVVLGLIVLIHEFGHFYFARKANILCHEFSVGMGPAIYQKRKGEIVYSVRAIPLGGYVAMAGEDITDSYIKEGQNIGIILNDKKEITDIILNDNLKYDLIGKVSSFDLYGENGKELYIELIVDDNKIKYNVVRDAKYQFSEKKVMWIAPYERSYEAKTLWQRFLTIFAGPATNFILAFLLLVIVGFIIGKPTNSTTVGKSKIDNINKNDIIEKVNGTNVDSWQDIQMLIQNSNNTSATLTIDGVDRNINLLVAFQGLGFTNAEGQNELRIGKVFGRKKDLEVNDKILAIYLGDKDKYPVSYYEPNNWSEMISYVNTNSNQKYVYLKVLRNNEEKLIGYDNIIETTLEKLGELSVAYGFSLEGERKFNLAYSLSYPFRKINSDIKEMLNTIGLMFRPSSGVSIKDLSGPIGIFTLVEQASSQGFISILVFTAFLSVNIGFLNLLPIPALDGGRLVFLGYEAIFRKKPSKKFENTLINITFILLLALIVMVTYQDIIRLFS